MSNNRAVESAIRSLRSIVEATCRHPERLEFRAVDKKAEVVIHIKVHPVDSRRIVGAAASNIRALQTMARLLFFGTGRIVNIQPIEWHKQPEGTYAMFEAKENWNEPLITNILETAATIVFHETCRVRAARINDEMTKLIVSVPQNYNIPEAVKTRFQQAAQVLFVPIGINHGRRLHVETETVSSGARA